MDKLFTDDIMRSPGLFLGDTASVYPEIVTEAEKELYQQLSLTGEFSRNPALAESEEELFNALGLSGPLLNFVKGVGQAAFNVARSGRNLVRGVFQKPPLPTYDLKTGVLQTALDSKTTVRMTQGGIEVGGSLVAPASQIDDAYRAGYQDAGGSIPVPGAKIDIPGLGPIDKQTAMIGGGAAAGLLLLLLLKK